MFWFVAAFRGVRWIIYSSFLVLVHVLLISTSVGAEVLTDKEFFPIEVDGRAKAFVEIEIYPEIRGIILSRNFDLGQAVKSGDILFTIDPESYQLAVERAQIDLDNARTALTVIETEIYRLSGLIEKKLVNLGAIFSLKVARDTARSHVNEVAADLKQAEVDLSHATMKSPIFGFVSLVNDDKGDLVFPEQAFAGSAGQMMTIVNYDPIKIVVGIDPVHDLRMFNSRVPIEDLTYTIILPNGLKYAHSGTFGGAYHRIDPETGLVTYELHFPNPDLLLLPGIRVKVQINKTNKE